ncbi:outer membrane beta-barrel protein [Microbulbifer sp. 2205BS26-8]|uniref:outer membrane beta-barrel protein n=1 Tax=Microbulbifer sp. 2205BS26-8 TaxID=3064386 RepID=UPI00273DB8D0|nr:outer membrane beta-barrel protein [Microbulbifer sp. 2205BS26-8]MDP5209679.1 outer membrane beta-barrel protein [Microbulbifer sp. 2205BS26-8]
MKRTLGALALLLPATVNALEWNNPFEGIRTGEYRVIATLGLGNGELQINNNRDFFAYASVGITPAVGVWQVELRGSRFDDSHIRVNQVGLNFKVDFTLNCYVQCLYWMVGWNYADIDLNDVRKHGYWYHRKKDWLYPVENWYYDGRYIHLLNPSGSDSFWNLGIGYRFMWTRDFDTSIEYNYNNIGSVHRVDLGHLRTLTVNFSYRF